MLESTSPIPACEVLVKLSQPVVPQVDMRLIYHWSITENWSVTPSEPTNFVLGALCRMAFSLLVPNFWVGPQEMRGDGKRSGCINEDSQLNNWIQLEVSVERPVLLAYANKLGFCGDGHNPCAHSAHLIVWLLCLPCSEPPSEAQLFCPSECTWQVWLGHWATLLRSYSLYPPAPPRTSCLSQQLPFYLAKDLL